MVKADWLDKVEKELETAKKEGEVSESVIALVSELRIHQSELETQNEELIQSQEELSELYHKYHELFDDAPLGYFTLDEHGIINDVNIKGAELLQLKKNQIIGLGFSHFIPKNYQNLYYTALSAAIDTYENKKVKLRLKKSETLFNSVMEIIPLFNKKDEKYRIVISESKEVEELLISESKVIGNLLEISEQPFNIRYPDGNPVYFNKAFENLLGYNKSELKLIDWSKKLTFSTCREMENTKLKELLNTGSPVRYENEYIRKDGIRIPVELLVHLVRDDNGEPLYFYSFITDITNRKKAEKKISRENQDLLDIIEFLPDPTFVIDDEGRVIAWNKAIELVTDVSKDEIVGKGDYVYSVPFYGEKRPMLIDFVLLDEQEIEAKYDYVHREGNCLIGEIFLDDFNGKGTYFFGKASPLYDGEGNIVGSIETIRDITEVRKAERAIKEAETILRGFFDATGDMMGIVDMVSDNDVRHVEDNVVTANFLGLKPEEMRNKLSSELGEAEEVLRSDIGHYRESKRTGKPVSFEYFDKRGTDNAWLLATVSYIGENSKGESRFAYVLRDITARKESELNLKHANQRLDIASRSAMVGIWDWDIKSGSIEWSPVMYELFGLGPKKDKASFEAWDKLLHPEDIEIANKRIEKAIEDHTLLDSEYRILRPDGDICWINALGKASYNKKGNPLWMTGVCLDISERKKNEEAIKNQSERLHLSLSAAKSGTWEWNLITNEYIWSEELWELYGLEPYSCEPSYDAWLKTIHPKDRRIVKNTLNKAKTNRMELNVEWRVFDPDGTERWLMSRGRPLHDESDHYIGVVIDITKQKNLEMALKESEERYKLILETANSGVFLLDLKNNIRYINKRMAEMLGYSVQDMVNQNLTKFLDIKEQKNISKFMDDWKKGSKRINEFKFLHKDGKKFWALLAASPILDFKGKYVGIIGVIMDITARKGFESVLIDRERISKNSLYEMIGMINKLVQEESKDEYYKTFDDKLDHT